MQIAAVAAAPAALGGIPRLPTSGSSHHLVLVEDSFAPAAAFALRAQVHGASLRLIRGGDITDAWLQSVRPAWQRGRASIAGLTTPSALFCLEQFAFAHGLRVVFHAEHVLLPDGRVTHQVQRSRQPITAATLDRAGGRWPQRLADTLVANRLVRAARPGPSLAALAPSLPAGSTLLTSWIIA
jgi:hypothetical protein